MKRRTFIKWIGIGMAGTGFGFDALAAAVRISSPAGVPARPGPDVWIKDYLHKMRNFDAHHRLDRFVDPADAPLFSAVRARLLRVQKIVGHGNFHLIGFDDSLRIARGYSRVGAFPRQEIDFMEALFYRDAADYGFFGAKAEPNLTAGIDRQMVAKIPRTGNYLYRGKPMALYRKLREAVGTDAVLTSGIRSVVKQFALFLNKAHASRGNLSMASRSLAPPGYSFHATGDFDVGQAGLGADNFTDAFAATDVYRRLADQGFVRLRYDRGNLLGVRFEPWHIKVPA